MADKSKDGADARGSEAKEPIEAFLGAEAFPMGRDPVLFGEGIDFFEHTLDASVVLREFL